jgi:hypothetical protein
MLRADDEAGCTCLIRHSPKVAMDALSRSSRTGHLKAREKRTLASFVLAELGSLYGRKKSPRCEPIGDDH